MRVGASESVTEASLSTPLGGKWADVPVDSDDGDGPDQRTEEQSKPGSHGAVGGREQLAADVKMYTEVIRLLQKLLTPLPVELQRCRDRLEDATGKLAMEAELAACGKGNLAGA